MSLLRLPVAIASVAATLTLAACGGGSDSGANAAGSDPTTSPSPRPSSSAPPAEPSLEQQVAPYCPDLLAALDKIPALNPTSEQIALLKQALEGGVRATATGEAKTEIESWYTTTTDLAVTAFGGGDDFTKKWAEWTMGTKVSIQAACNA